MLHPHLPFVFLRIKDPQRVRLGLPCSKKIKSSVQTERGGEREREREDRSDWQRWRRREKETSKTTIAERKQTRKVCEKEKKEKNLRGTQGPLTN